MPGSKAFLQARMEESFSLLWKTLSPQHATKPGGAAVLHSWICNLTNRELVNNNNNNKKKTESFQLGFRGFKTLKLLYSLVSLMFQMSVQPSNRREHKQEKKEKYQETFPFGINFRGDLVI